jgi:hypothetical protein
LVAAALRRAEQSLEAAYLQPNGLRHNELAGFGVPGREYFGFPNRRGLEKMDKLLRIARP